MRPHFFGPRPVPVPVNVVDLHFPVFAMKRGAHRAQIERPVVYGTAFPIAAGVLVTPAHVWEAAYADGMPILSRIPGPGRKFAPLAVNDAEVFRAIDVALVSKTGRTYRKRGERTVS